MLDQWYGILPNTILFDKNLSDKEKLLYVLISSLCAEKWHCRANNMYFSEKLWITKSRMSNWITSLWEKWYIQIDVRKDEWNKRYISIANNSKTYCWKEQEGIAENSKHNNTNNNSINNNSLSKKSLHDDKIKDKLLNDWIRFEEFWKKYPRGTSNWVTKKIVLEYYKRANEDEDEIIYQIKIINWMVDLWLQEEKYTKSCNNWVIWYKPEPQVIIQQKIKNIVYKIREKNLDKDEDIATRLINDFGKDVIMKYSREYHNEYKWVKIKLS